MFRYLLHLVGMHKERYQKVFRIETVSPEGIFCDTVQVPFGAGDIQLI